MSIESDLKAIRGSLEQLVAMAMAQQAPSAPEQATPPATAAPAAAAPPAPVAPPTPPQAAPTAASKTPVTAPVSPPAAPACPISTAQELQAYLTEAHNALTATKGPVVGQILQKYGYQDLSNVDPNDFPAIYADVEQEKQA